MRLTSIKLSGFKSFVDPTNFQVPGQLVGVVGPNGCGKSNIIDAVRWVLGESKASELRGESMQDVIFNGTSTRKPAGRSSVELVFDNGDGKAAGQWGQYAEIAVKRTLTRDGTSTYYINNQPVRRRDIQDIFLGTGLGPRAYAIIGQGMISRIIEARPEELRIFLEEAAGVSKYKERRRETENRLHDTRENLIRVDDILQELNTNLEKLQGQAAVAQRFRSLQADQDEKQKLLWLLRRNEARTEQARFFADIEQAQTELESQTAQLRHIETELEQTRQAHYAAGERTHEAQGYLYQTNSEIGSLEAQIRFVLDSRGRLQSQLDSLKAQRDQWERQSALHGSELSKAETLLEEQTMHMEHARETAEQHHDAMPALEQDWREAQLKTAESRAGMMQVRQQITLESTHQRNAASILAGLATRRERLLAESASLQLPDDADLCNLKAQLEEKRAMLDEVQQRLASAQEHQPQLDQQRREAQIRVNAESAAYAQLDARLVALQQLQESVQTQGKVQPWLNKHALAGLPRMWQKLHIAAGWEAALESVLRERTAALELTDFDRATTFFGDAPPGKLAFCSPAAAHGLPPAGSCPAAVPDSGVGLQPLVDLLQMNDPELRALMQEWLHDVYVAADTDSGFSERSRLPPGGTFVTRAGHLIGRASVRFYAPDAEQDGMLARQQEIDNLVKQLRAQQMLTDDARNQAFRADSALAQAVQQLQELRSRTAGLTQAMHGLQLDVMKLSDVQTRFEQRSAQIHAELAEISAQESEQLDIQAFSEARYAELDMALAELQDAHENDQSDYLGREQRLDDARLRLRELERAAQESTFAEKTHRSRIEELKRSIATAHGQAAQLYANMQQGSLELESLDDQAAQTGLQMLLQKRSEQERALTAARQELDQMTQKLRQHDEGRLQAERGLQPQRERIMGLQLKEQAARLNQEQYALQLVQAEADEALLKEKLSADLRPAYFQGEVTRLTQAIAALGAVNLAALDELAQASERKVFLDAQTADLTEAINTLQDAIYKIDRETRDLLQDTFDKVNHHFGELFPILFGGGNAKLVMTGDEILDSGVQVMAQPPGKKNATIHLLSGGEKALTATALVFSMFQLNPAPFCLLDEVDAPLDDANTERFCNMVKRMSAQTQFLFISHNKIAMEMAQQLIGVTMQEQGVSRIVAVDMESAGNFAVEAAAA